MNDVFLVQPVGTAIGKFQCALEDVPAVELGCTGPCGGYRIEVGC